MKRRNFLLATSGIAGGIFVPASRAAVPCPPPLVTAGGSTAVSPSCPTTSGGSSSALATLATSLSSGQWASFTMGGMNLSLLDVGNGHSITEYASRGHWDPVHKKIQFWGHGHYSGTKLITWDDATNQWSLGIEAGFDSLGHAYYHLALDPLTGDLYLRQYSTGRVKKKPYGGAWVEIASHHNVANQVAGGLEWSPALNGGSGGLVFCDQLSAETWNPSTNGWTLRSTSLALGPYSNWIAAAAGQVYFGGGNGSSAMFRMSTSGALSSAPATPIQAGVGAGIVMRHPDGNQLLMFGQGTTGSIHRFDGTSWLSHGTHQIGGSTNLWFGVPVSDYGIVLFVAQTASSGAPTVKVYKP
jgi:hypothetical protein